MANIHFIGLHPGTAAQLRSALSRQNHQVEAHPLEVTVDKVAHADVVFAAGDDFRYRRLLTDIRARKPDLPFIVVTRLPETKTWLDALEAGATDYCAEPIEARQIEWLLDSALGRKMARAAA